MNILDADDDEDLAVASASMLVCGVYEIADAFGRSYIGSSVNIYRRWEEHRRELVAGNHHAHKLQRAWRNQSADKFRFRVLEFVQDLATLRDREQYYLDAFVPHFNTSLIVRGSVLTGEERERSKAKQLDRALISEIRKVGEYEQTRRECLEMLSTVYLAYRFGGRDDCLAALKLGHAHCLRAGLGLNPFSVNDRSQYECAWEFLTRDLPVKRIRELCLAEIEDVVGGRFEVQLPLPVCEKYVPSHFSHMFPGGIVAPLDRTAFGGVLSFSRKKPPAKLSTVIGSARL